MRRLANKKRKKRILTNIHRHPTKEKKRNISMIPFRTGVSKNDNDLSQGKNTTNNNTPKKETKRNERRNKGNHPTFNNDEKNIRNISLLVFLSST